MCSLKVIKACYDLIRELIFVVKSKQASEVAELCLYLGEEATIGITSRPWYRHNNLWRRIQEESNSSHLQLPRILTCAVEVAKSRHCLSSQRRL